MPTLLLTCLPFLSLAGWLGMFGLKHVNFFAGNLSALVYHLALIPLVRYLPGGPEVVFAGYLWLFMDALIDIAIINGIGDTADWPLRMGVHLFAGIWILGVSLGMGGAVLWIGAITAVGLVAHAVFGASLPNTRTVLGVFIMPMMSAWLVALGVVLLRRGLPL